MSDVTDLKSVSICENENLPKQIFRMDQTFRMLSDRRFNSFLELGCDTGYMSEKLARISDQLIAVDKNEKAISYAKEYHASDNVDYRISDFLGLEFEPHSFDGISGIESLYYFSDEDRALFMERIKTWLKPGGLFVFGAPIQLDNEEERYFAFPEALQLFVSAFGFRVIKEQTVLRVDGGYDDTTRPFLLRPLHYLSSVFDLGHARNHVVLAIVV
jgi:SAM-dependent methyltransferase